MFYDAQFRTRLLLSASDEEIASKTDFAPDAHFEFFRRPFGLSNAFTVSQDAIDTMLGLYAMELPSQHENVVMRNSTRSAP